MPEWPRAAKMAGLERHMKDTHFCWIGGNGPKDPFYYRIQSPMIFIEFDHHLGPFQTNDIPLNYHVHTVIRSANGNDYGFDVLRQYYSLLHGNFGGHHHSHD
ncbi:MAG: DUF3500 domain-containing protein [Spongiibacteraceae bacterium]